MKLALFIGSLSLLGISSWLYKGAVNESSSIIIKKTSDGSLVALIKNNASYPNTIYVLQTTADLTDFQQIELVGGRVQEGKKCVEFRSFDGQQKIVFNLSSNSCSIATNDARVFNGYGLIGQQNKDKYDRVLNFSEPVLPSIKEILTCHCLTAGEMSEGGCLSGGVGATECSYEIKGAASGSVSGSEDIKCWTKCEGNSRYACCLDK